LQRRIIQQNGGKYENKTEKSESREGLKWIGGLYEPENMIRVKTEELYNGNWNTYRFGALTLDQAFDNWYYG